MKLENEHEHFGRLRIVKGMSDGNGPSLSVGCKDTRLADINIDIDVSVFPDIIADVLHLPLRNEVFDTVFFTEVIEHLPENTEIQALKEIKRVLKNEGKLILTTPNNRAIFTLLDPARYIMTHRHYNILNIKYLLQDSGFIIEEIFTMGGIYECLGVLYYCLVVYPLNRLFNRNLSYAPTILCKLIDSEYDIKSIEGYTILIKAKKNSGQIGNVLYGNR